MCIFCIKPVKLNIKGYKHENLMISSYVLKILHKNL